MPISIIAYNTLKYSITKRTPFFINKGFEADIFIKTRKYKELILYIVIIVEEIYELQEDLYYNLIFFNKMMKKFINKKRVRGLTLKIKKELGD